MPFWASDVAVASRPRSLSQSQVRLQPSRCQVHDTAVVGLVLRMRAGVVEQPEHQVIRGQTSATTAEFGYRGKLNSVIAGNLCELVGSADIDCGDIPTT